MTAFSRQPAQNESSAEKPPITNPASNAPEPRNARIIGGPQRPDGPQLGAGDRQVAGPEPTPATSSRGPRGYVALGGAHPLGSPPQAGGCDGPGPLTHVSAS